LRRRRRQLWWRSPLRQRLRRRPGCDTTTGLCKGDATCVPATCDNGSLFNYCGDVGDGCGGTLHCGNDCAAGQTCDTTTGLCKGDTTCVPVVCDNGTPFKYCGENGNGCGGALHCGNDCAANQVCGADGICKGNATCVPVTCDNGTPFGYCGDIGDGCGGAVKCGTRCGANQICGTEGLCKGDSHLRAQDLRQRHPLQVLRRGRRRLRRRAFVRYQLRRRQGLRHAERPVPRRQYLHAHHLVRQRHRLPLLRQDR
jgi:hypothetical protein